MMNVNQKYGTQVAADFDFLLWGKLMPVEVHRFKKLFNLRDDLLALTECWVFSIAMEEGLECEWVELSDKRVSWQVTKCPIQLRRRQEGLDELPCKQGLANVFENLAAAVNPKIKVAHCFAPPDPHPDNLWCGVTWEMKD